MANIFKIHPSVGISRLGDSTTEFCLAPETALGLPVKCDSQGRALHDEQGNERPIDMFKDSQGRIKRQAARFRVYVYKDANDQVGHELKIGDYVEVYKRQTGEQYRAIVLDIEWTVYLAKKKASRYQFKDLEGQRGYAPNHPLRNAAIKDAAARQRLIIDPGPQTVSSGHQHPRHAKFSKGKNPAFPQCFPTTLSPKNIDTLGEIMVNQQDDHSRLIVLGGHGHAGSFKVGSNESRTANLSSGDGWFDDVSDGPVTANLWLQHLLDDSGSECDLSPFSIPVDDPAWVLVTYPGYVPEIDNMITVDDIVYDLALREMDYNPDVYGPVADDSGIASVGATLKDWNREYYPYFYRDIWPILSRPNVYQWLMVFNSAEDDDPYSSVPNEHGNFDFDVISLPPHTGQDPAERQANAEQRQYIYGILRRPGPANLFRALIKYNTQHEQSRLISKLSGDNRSAEAPAARFLRLTDTQLFFLQQWVDGKFVNEKLEGLETPIEGAPVSGSDLDHGVLRSALGGAFCLGKEVCWVIRNPAIYAKPYRIKHASYEPGMLSQPAAVAGAGKVSDLSRGLEPGDLTKYSILPWQADFNESSNQEIDITYETWVNSDLTGPISTDVEMGVFWWVAHRPMEVFLPLSTPFGNLTKNQVPWVRADADGSSAVTAWVTLGFVHELCDPENPDLVELADNDNSDNLALFQEQQTQ